MQKIVQKPFLGHPNRICDSIAEAVVDECIRRDANSKLAVRVFGGHGAIMVSGEWVSRAEFDCAQLVRKVYAELGYVDEVEPFVHLGIPRDTWAEARTKGVSNELVIAKGYATRATREGVPIATVFVHDIVRRVHEARLHDSHMAWLRPDGYAWVAVEGSRPVQMGVQTQHTEGTLSSQIQTELFERVLQPLSMEKSIKYTVNPQGICTVGGFAGASGQSGMEDLWYGGLIPMASAVGLDGAHPLRAGTFMARFLAKQILKQTQAQQAWAQIVYTPGHAEPTSVQLLADTKDMSVFAKGFDLRAEAIADRFQLRRPMYRRLAEEGPWTMPDAAWEE